MCEASPPAGGGRPGGLRAHVGPLCARCRGRRPLTEAPRPRDARPRRPSRDDSDIPGGAGAVEMSPEIVLDLGEPAAGAGHLSPRRPRSRIELEREVAQPPALRGGLVAREQYFFGWKGLRAAGSTRCHRLSPDARRQVRQPAVLGRAVRPGTYPAASRPYAPASPSPPERQVQAQGRRAHRQKSEAHRVEFATELRTGCAAGDTRRDDVAGERGDHSTRLQALHRHREVRAHADLVWDVSGPAGLTSRSTRESRERGSSTPRRHVG